MEDIWWPRAGSEEGKEGGKKKKHDALNPETPRQPHARRRERGKSRFLAALVLLLLVGS
jgi:hypothetical protein